MLGAVNTDYTYDVLNHLTKSACRAAAPTRPVASTTTPPGTTVTGFLQSATNPENGTVIYTYNTYNLLATKTDAKNQKLTYRTTATTG